MSTVALSPREELAEMEHRLGSKAAVGRVIRRDPAVVSRWMGKRSRPNPASRSLVDAAYVVVMCLADRGYDDADLEAVLTRPWPGLEDRSPAELIARCEVAPILDAINAPAVDGPPTGNDLAPALAAAARAEPIVLDPRLAGFGGHPAATAERITMLEETVPGIPDPRGRVRGGTSDRPLDW